MKKYLLLFIAFVMCFITASCGNSNNSTQYQTVNKDDISFQIPEDWVVEDYETDVLCHGNKKSKILGALSITITNHEDLILDSNLYDAMDTDIIDIMAENNSAEHTDIDIDGIPGEKVTYINDSKSCITEIFVINNYKLYNFSIHNDLDENSFNEEKFIKSIKFKNN